MVNQWLASQNNERYTPGPYDVKFQEIQASHA